MAKCDICNKTSLLPEKFGEVNICKLCFMKINGPLWKYQYDKYETAEKQRCRTLETMHKQNIPQSVVSSVNDFFMNQINAMQRCEACGENVGLLQSIGTARLCKNCYGKICNSPAWKESDYDDNKSVEENRQKILKIATKYSYPQNVFDGINEHFDGYIQAGLIETVDGKDQKLKVFETYCILETDNDFDEEEVAAKYAKVLKKSKQGGGLISNSVAKVVVHSVLSGGIVKAGISLAKSAIADAAIDAVAPDRPSIKVRKGKFRINYDVYDIVEFQKTLTIGFEDELGYMRFRSSHQSVNELMFFFTYNHYANEMYKYICERIEEIKQSRIEEATSPQNEYFSAADELLKFKQLLDMGVITQEEFDAKKKQLLGL